jgi:hypothetical protein
MTYGDLKFRLLKAFPGLDLDLLEGWIGDTYAEILGALPWTRLNVQAILETTAQYTAGLVQVTLGSQTVTLTGGTWDSTMGGRGFRVSPRTEFYEFTYVSATSGSLDRPYEGPTSTTAGYQIFQNVYPLPANCRLLNDDAFTSRLGQMQRTTHGQLEQTAPWRTVNGIPLFWASYMDDNSTPPRMQVELYPIPEIAVGLPFSYVADADPLSATNFAFQVWMQPAAMLEGVTAKIKAYLKDYTGAAMHMSNAKLALLNMLSSEAQGMAPASMQLDPYFTRHRCGRCR